MFEKYQKKQKRGQGWPIFLKKYLRTDSRLVNVIFVLVDLDDEGEAARLGGHRVAAHAGLHGRVRPRHRHLFDFDL